MVLFTAVLNLPDQSDLEKQAIHHFSHNFPFPPCFSTQTNISFI